MKSERNYGIDLLRLVLMYMVCMLHTLGQGGILNACEAGSAEYNVFWFMEILAYCAVDGFAIISGYTAADKPRKFEKLADMWFQVFFYSFIITAVLTAVGLNPDWNVKELIKCAMPVTFDRFWYFTAYFALFFAIPVLNKFIFAADEKTARTAFLLLVALFSCIEFLEGSFKLQGGYCALWLMVLYCIGALAKRGRIFEQKKSITLIAIWAVCILATWYGRAILGIERLLSYVSPTILASGLIMVVLFSRLRLKGTVISKLSPLAFGIYLFHLNPVIWKNLQGGAALAAKTNIAVGVMCALAIAGIIFLSGLIVESLRVRLAKLMRIPELSCRIVALAECVLKKALIILN